MSDFLVSILEFLLLILGENFSKERVRYVTLHRGIIYSK